jgi:CRISPR-associated protein Cas2
MLALVVYDIPHDKRRTKLANFLEGYGRRVQFSVFECFLSLDEMRVLSVKVAKLVNPEEDNVRFYWISEEAISRAISIGSPAPSPPAKYYVV